MSVEYSAVTELSKRFEMAARVAPDLADRFLVNQFAEPVVREMRADAPVRSGALRDSIRFTHPERLKVVIGSFGVSYAKFVAEGTKAHEIRPKNASALAFKVGGKMVYAKVVRHPGTKANPFMSEAADKVAKRVLPNLAGIMLQPLKGNGQ